MNVDVSTNPSFDQIADSDFRIEWFSGTGAGGQHRNKSQNSCRVIHIPTGISEARQSRSRENNYLEAKKAILETLKNKKTSENHDKFSDTKASKLGSGMRGDKLLTIQFQNDKVTHHVTGKTCTAKQFMKGEVDRLWNTKEAV